MIQNKALIIVYLVLVGLYAPASSAQEGPALVLKGADIQVKPGQVISSGMLLIRNGRIAEVGRSVTIPDGAEVVDLSGRGRMMDLGGGSGCYRPNSCNKF